MREKRLSDLFFEIREIPVLVVAGLLTRNAARVSWGSEMPLLSAKSGRPNERNKRKNNVLKSNILP